MEPSKDNSQGNQQKSLSTQNSIVENTIQNVENPHVESNQDFRKQRSRWNISENKRYCAFLIVNEQILMKEFKREKQKIFNQMQKFIGSTRNSRHCKSHHQKMMKKHGSIKSIIKALAPQIPSKNIVKDDPMMMKNKSKRKSVDRSISENLQPRNEVPFQLETFQSLGNLETRQQDEQIKRPSQSDLSSNENGSELDEISFCQSQNGDPENIFDFQIRYI